METVSKEEIGICVDNNYLVFASDSQGINGCSVSEDAFVTQFISKYQVPWMNGVLKTDATVDELENRVKEILDSYKTPMTWRVGPLSKNNAQLHEILVSIGLKHSKEPCLRLDLKKFRAEKAPSELTIELLTTKKHIEDYLVPFCEGFSVPEDVAEHFRIYAQERISISKLPQKWFVGYCDDQPACCVTWVAACGVNMIYNVCTVNKFRKRGFARQMVELAIESSLSEVDQPVCLYSSTMGFELYKRIGFVEQFVRNDYVLQLTP